MIIVQTKMKKLPEKCTECKFSHTKNGFRCCGALSNKALEMEFVQSKNNWSYVRPKFCPLAEIKSIEK